MKTETLKKIYKIRLKKGDTVIVLSGKNKGKTGIVEAIHPFDNKVTVKGMNIVKRHRKPTRTNPQGTIEEINKPMWVSKVAIVEPTSKKPSKIGYTSDKSGKKVRIFKRTGKEIK